MKKKLEMPSREYLHSILEYRDGLLYWKIRPNSKRKSGDVAGTFTDGWYATIGIDGKRFFQHRIIWHMMIGDLADDYDIDHINRNKHDNRIENLREVPRTFNLHNRDSMNIRVTRSGTYEAYVGFNRQTIRKNFKIRSEAEKWVEQKKKELLDNC